LLPTVLQLPPTHERVSTSRGPHGGSKKQTPRKAVRVRVRESLRLSFRQLCNAHRNRRGLFCRPLVVGIDEDTRTNSGLPLNSYDAHGGHSLHLWRLVDGSCHLSPLVRPRSAYRGRERTGHTYAHIECVEYLAGSTVAHHTHTHARTHTRTHISSIRSLWQGDRGRKSPVTPSRSRYQPCPRLLPSPRAKKEANPLPQTQLVP
jgi:hypothetical protein